METKTLAIHWFRRDLRIADNPALHAQILKHQGRVLGIFCFDSKFLTRDDFSHHRFAFFLKTLASLQKDMRAAGGDLLVLDQLPIDAFSEVLKNIRPTFKVQTFSWNRDYEPYARERDQKIKAFLSKDFDIITERDHLIIEPYEVTKSESPSEKNYYQVYSPFAKKWYGVLHAKDISADFKIQKFKIRWSDVLKKPFKDELENFNEQNSKYVTIEIPAAGTDEAFGALKEFSSKISDYSEARNFPDQNATSHFSIYFKNGSLTTSQVVSFLKLQKLKYDSESGANRFLKEIAWREFYYSILYHVPRVEHEAFLEKYNNIKWQNNKTLFKAWCEGQTGYPIIDAGMRQLNSTGWMHNRVRMIVASFLTKDLLIDWRWGENYFMKMLLDGDLAPNNGGWQWAASTGCDPQPYFRIFNPLLQSQKFDPKGDYIRKYIPELRHLNAKDIHAPAGVDGYPRPIVVHAEQKAKALALYRAILLP